MAKRNRIATGLTIENIMKMPISKIQSYSPTAQREIVSRLVSAGNKRLRTLEKKDINNAATLRLYNSGGKLSVKGKSEDELIKEYIRARDFLQNKFSKVSEWNKTVKNLMKNETLSKMDEKDVSQAFSYYESLREMNPAIVNRINEYQLLDYIEELIMDDTPREEIINKSIKWVNDEYKRTRDEYNRTITRFTDSLEYDIPERINKRKKRKYKRR